MFSSLREKVRLSFMISNFHVHLKIKPALHEHWRSMLHFLYCKLENYTKVSARGASGNSAAPQPVGMFWVCLSSGRCGVAYIKGEDFSIAWHLNEQRLTMAYAFLIGISGSGLQAMVNGKCLFVSIIYLLLAWFV